jgi:superfamily II DNA or RNA helicase
MVTTGKLWKRFLMSQASLFDDEEKVEEQTVTLDPVRTKRQLEAVDKWIANNGKGTLQAVTGFGKTHTVLLGAEKLVNSPNATYQRDVTVVTPSLEIKRSWEEQAKNYDFEIRVFTIQTLVRRFSRGHKLETSLLVLDEFHRYFSDVHGTVFDIVDYSFIFGTTATIDPSDPKFMPMRRYAPIIDTITLEEALEHGWVSHFDIYNLGVEMTQEEEAAYGSIQRSYNKYFKTFDFDFDMANRCLNDQYAREAVAKNQGVDPQLIMIHAANFFRTIQKRREFLYNLPQKVPITAEIIRRFSDDIFITFSLSTDFADQLDDELGDLSVAYHSSLPTLIVDKHTGERIAKGVKVDGKTRYKDSTGQTYDWKGIKKAYPKRNLLRKGKTRRRKEALETFRQSEKCRVVSTAKALDEGFNVPGITASVVASGYSKVRQSIQRLGRMIRKQPGKRAFQVELYVKNTQEEVWLKKRQEDSINIKWITDINEIAT